MDKIYSNFRGELRKWHVSCNTGRIDRSRLSKVVDFGTNRKGVCDFLLVINSNFGPLLHRFWLIGWKLWIYPIPHSHLTPSLVVNCFEFLDEFFIVKNSSWAIRRWRFRDPSLRRFDTVPACDRRLAGRTDGQTDSQLNSSYIYKALHGVTGSDADVL